MDAWGTATWIERFFDDAAQRAATLAEEERAIVMQRLESALSLVGGTDALARLRAWKAPDER